MSDFRYPLSPRREAARARLSVVSSSPFGDKKKEQEKEKFEWRLLNYLSPPQKLLRRQVAKPLDTFLSSVPMLFSNSLDLTLNFCHWRILLPSLFHLLCDSRRLMKWSKETKWLRVTLWLEMMFSLVQSQEMVALMEDNVETFMIPVWCLEHTESSTLWELFLLKAPLGSATAH